jgi:hypothetical protein
LYIVIFLALTYEKVGNGSYYIWTSGSDSRIEGQWKWMATGHDLTYTNYGSCMSHQANGDCLSINYDSPYNWCDQKCSDQRPFVCEMYDACY